MRSQLPFLLLLSVLLSVDARGGIVGGWTPIKDVNDPHVRDIGQYAVAEHDRRTGEGLSFDRVVSGATQVVAGINYRLVISASGGGVGAAEYEAVVWEKAWEGFRNLTSFKPINNA
ncbi:Cysteine proteinase inhibitor 5 [Acorus gramineus]|uniref:Cysteine proteinase inhibitor 5 n=1 Tax=Acorus gramineus TaxID=55184 RepID=A0AAV9BBH0_ACOGR|nr:Cysteine proteinase inhibitor 5 [Acorus gramineus]